MSQTVRRCSRALAALAVACGAVALAAPAATADPQVPFSQDVYARTHLARSGIDITVPPGRFDGTIDLATGEETGTLTLPPATVTMNLLGVIPAADASFVMEPAGPITGHVDLATFAVDTTASFDVKLAKLTPHGTDVNLVGDDCTTTAPITVRMQGVVNPAAGGTFSSTYTIPDFQDCRLLTPVITAFVSGPGNTFLASFAPHGSPPPATTDPTPATAPPLVGVDAHGSVTIGGPPVGGTPVGGTPVGGTTLPIDQHLTVPAPSTPPLVTATPAPQSTPAPPVLPAPPAPPSAGTIGDLLGSLLGGG
jgi:hypothetical protein